jgi:hypothetical protein
MSEWPKMICRAIRPSTESHISIEIDMQYITTPEEGVEWVMENHPGFMPMSFKLMTQEEFEKEWIE